MKLWLLPLVASLVWGQTRVDLKSQSRNVDFSNATSVKPIPVGTVMPSSCAAGEMFFRSNAVPGENLYGCAVPNTWVQQTSASAAGFTDLQSSVAGTTLTIVAGRASFNVNGVPVVLSLGPGTITKNEGSDTGTFLIFADYNAGAPGLRCLADGVDIGNYTVSGAFAGSTCASGSSFPAFSIPVAMVDISLGTLQPPQDLRSALSRDPLVAGAGLLLVGNTVSLASGVGTGGVKRIAYAALPSCSQAELNSEYLFTDGVGISAHCNGTSHAYFYSDQPIVLPGEVSSFTKVNATGGRDVMNDQGGLYVHAESSGGDNLVTALKSLAGATDVRAAVVFGSPGGDFNSCGLVLADGVTSGSKVTLFGRQAQSGQWRSQVMNYSSYIADAGSTQQAVATAGAPVWLRAVVSGGNHEFYVSVDGGRTWELSGTQAAYETATQYGVGCDARGATTAAGMLVVSLSAQ